MNPSPIFSCQPQAPARRVWRGAVLLLVALAGLVAGQRALA